MAEKKDNGKSIAIKEGGIKSIIMSDVMKGQFAIALPKHLTPDRFVRVALTAMNKTPKLLKCTKESLLACLMDCSQMGLEPDGRRAHLIPYGDKCTLIVDYKGLVELARRSGTISDVHADVVYERDEFRYSFGTNGELVHKPALKDRGEVIAAYSFVKLKDGSTSYEVMNKDEVEAIKARSKAKDSGPWVTDWAEMAKKTVFRRHSKWLPISSEFQQAIEKDYDVPADIVDVTPELREPQALPEKKKSTKPSKPSQKSALDQSALEKFEIFREVLGDEEYFRILGNNGVEKPEDISSWKKAATILKEMDDASKAKK